MKLNVDRDVLLHNLNTNREAHEAIFQEAVEGYRKETLKQLNDYIDRIKRGSLKRVYVSLPEPVNHLKEYDNIIGLIEMSNDKIIPLTDDEHRFYVKDDWAWKQQFLGSNSMYSVTASQALENDDDDED